MGRSAAGASLSHLSRCRGRSRAGAWVAALATRQAGAATPTTTPSVRRSATLRRSVLQGALHKLGLATRVNILVNHSEPGSRRGTRRKQNSTPVRLPPLASTACMHAAHHHRRARTRCAWPTLLARIPALACSPASLACATQQDPAHVHTPHQPRTARPHQVGSRTSPAPHALFTPLRPQALPRSQAVQRSSLLWRTVRTTVSAPVRPRSPRLHSRAASGPQTMTTAGVCRPPQARACGPASSVKWRRRAGGARHPPRPAKHGSAAGVNSRRGAVERLLQVDCVLVQAEDGAPAADDVLAQHHGGLLLEAQHVEHRHCARADVRAGRGGHAQCEACDTPSLTGGVAAAIASGRGEAAVPAGRDSRPLACPAGRLARTRWRRRRRGHGSSPSRMRMGGSSCEGQKTSCVTGQGWGGPRGGCAGDGDSDEEEEVGAGAGGSGGAGVPRQMCMPPRTTGLMEPSPDMTCMRVLWKEGRPLHAEAQVAAGRSAALGAHPSRRAPPPPPHGSGAGQASAEGLACVPRGAAGCCVLAWRWRGERGARAPCPLARGGCLRARPPAPPPC